MQCIVRIMKQIIICFNKTKVIQKILQIRKVIMHSTIRANKSVLFQSMRYVFITLLLIICTCCTADNDNGFEPPSYSPYRIMIVPDIQNYATPSVRLKYLDSIASYYLDNTNDLVACFQVGDITNNNLDWQYLSAYDHFFCKFPKGREPYFCLGNHDYGENGLSGTRTSNIPDYMKPVFDFQMEGCDYENYVRFLTIGEKDYAIMDLEFAPRNETLDWANAVVQEYSTTPFIIITHAFINKDAQLFDASDENIYSNDSQKSYKMGSGYNNDSMEIFNKLIYNNPNIMMVICGHSLFPHYIEVTSKENSLGNNVYMIAVNYQHYKDGGSGYVGILEFGEDNYRIRSFSTVNKQYGSRDITFGGVTAVKNVETKHCASAEVFNLQGQRVKKARKGVYVVNRKIVIF